MPALHRDGALLASGLVGLKGTISRKANKAVAAMHAQAMLGRHFLGAWSDEVRWDARLRWLKCQAEAHNLRASLVRALLCWSWNAKRRRMGGAGMAVAVLHRVGVVCRGMLRMWRHRAARARRERECKEEGERGGEGGGEEEEGEEAKEDGGLQEDDIARGGAGGTSCRRLWAVLADA